MAKQIQATVYQIDGSPQPSPITVSFLTSNIVILEASLSTIPQVNAAIKFYPNPVNLISEQTFYVAESVASLLIDCNVGGTSQFPATILEINNNPLAPGGVSYTFPCDEVSIWESVNAVTGVNSYITFKGVNYFASETQATLVADANAGSGGGGVTSVSANQGVLVNNADPTNPIVYIGYTAENTANKSTDVNLSANSDTLFPTQKAVKTYADGLVTGLLDDRGNYDASSNLFPSTGGSGTAGAILKGDLWFISVGGTLGGSPVLVGSSVRALVNSPGQTAANWDVLDTGVGFTPENVINKSTDGTFAANSDTLYPSQKAVKTYVTANAGPGGYKIYTVLLSMTSYNVFTVQQLKNTIGDGSNDGINDIKWAVSGFGGSMYADMTSGSPFVSGKVWINPGVYNNGSQPYTLIGESK